MADIDEDAPVNTLYRGQSNDDDEPGDETQDYRLLASLTSKSSSIPKRGEKDFEPHGTKHQDGILAASRQAMHDALDYTRVHVPKHHVLGFYYGTGGLERDKVVREDWRQNLDDDHIVVVHKPRGPLYKVMGQAAQGKYTSSLWLLPEEALYLVERGNLDLRWPSRESFNGIYQEREGEGNEDSEDSEEDTKEESQATPQDSELPMSFQAAYAMLIGEDHEKGKVSLERYTVYSNLKRAGYIVLRAPEWNPMTPGKVQSYQLSGDSSAGPSQSIFSWLFGLFVKGQEQDIRPYGPLVKPGMYRSYDSIYRQLAVIPRHKPSANPQEPYPPPEDPYRVVFRLWKSTRVADYRKTRPGAPDFRVAVVDARSIAVPTLQQAASLLESTPWDPPAKEDVGPSKLYQRLRHGHRNVIVAVIDQGIISYLRLGEAAFGEEKLYEKFDQGSIQGNKRGGFRGRGRGRGRGGRR